MLTRRALLQQASVAGLGLAMTEFSAFGFPAEWLQAQEAVVPFTDVPADFATANPTNGRISGMDLRELTSFITPERNYFVVAHYPIPKIDPASFKLQITGRVA